MKALTDRQRQVLQAIVESITDTGYPPTIREIGTTLGIKSTNGVNDHLKALTRKGYIERDTSKSRAIMLTAKAETEFGLTPASTSNTDASVETLSVPLLGRIAAGIPIEAIEQVEDRIVMDPSLFGPRSSGNVFALTVEGESMIGDGILDGDTIFVRETQAVREGEVVAVMVDGSATVKRHYREGNTIRLVPSNPDMEDILVHAQDGRDVRVLGKVVGVYRRI